MSSGPPTSVSPRESFEQVYRHFGRIAAYAARRGSYDPEGIAAETMTIAWRRITELDDEPLPWLIVTARNLLYAEYRSRRRSEPMGPSDLEDLNPQFAPGIEVESLEPAINRVLQALAPVDREALLLVAWEELTPSEAAAALGIRPAAFRVRLHRARRRFRRMYAEEESLTNPFPTLDTQVPEGKS